MTNCDYIVPIYYEGELNGTGFIVGNLLITAVHVVVSKDSTCFFIFNGENIDIGSHNNIHFEYPKDKSKQGQNNLYWDIAIYYAGPVNSPQILAKANIAESCVYQGYSDNESLMDAYDNIIIDDKDRYFPPEEEHSIRINNTYLSTKGMCKKGNSGGPLFQGDRIVGMLVGGQQFSRFSLDRYIRSDYIIEIIARYDSNNTSYKTND